MSDKKPSKTAEEARDCMKQAVHDELVKKAKLGQDVIINRNGEPYKIPAAEALETPLVAQAVEARATPPATTPVATPAQAATVATRAVWMIRATKMVATALVAVLAARALALAPRITPHPVAPGTAAALATVET